MASILSLLLVSGCAGPRPAAKPGPVTLASEPPAEAPARPTNPAARSAPQEVSDDFATRVAPILAAHCGRCHLAGGVMYERMPFDDPKVVRSRKDGILKRLKEPAEREAFERWLRKE